MPFDLLTATSAKEGKNKHLEQGGRFDLSTAKPISEEVEPVKAGLIDYLRTKYRKGYVPMARGAWGREAMWGRMDTKEALEKGSKAVLEQLERAGKIEDYTFKEAPVKFFLGEAAELLPFMLGATKEGAKHALGIGGGFAGIAFLAGQAGPQALLPEEVVTVPVSFAAGVSVGFPYGVIKYSLDFEGGNLYLDLIDNGIDERTARPLALAGGLAIGVIEVAQLKLLTSPLRRAFAKTLTSKLSKAALAKVMGNYLKVVGGELLEEELQEIVQLATEGLAGMLEAKPDAIPTREEWLKRLILVAKKAGPGMAVLALPGAAIEAGSYAIRAREIIEESMEEEAPKPPEVPPEAPERPPVEAIAPKIAPKVKPTPIMPELEEIARRSKTFEEFAKAVSEKPEIDLTPLKTTDIKSYWESIKVKPIPPKALAVEVSEKFRGRLEEIQETFKTEKARTKKEIKAVQEEIIRELEASKLEAKDKAKFIRVIKNVQTQEQLVRALPEIGERIERLVQQEKKRGLKKQIKKELKYTKPVKKGLKKVGKYDYQTNKAFQEITELTKLSQEQAGEKLNQLGDPKNNADAIKARLLSMQANGMDSSPQLLEQVLKDIQFLKQEGQRSKNEEDFLKNIKRELDVDNAVELLKRRKASKEAIITRIVNLYRKGFSNIYSMINSILDKKTAEELDPELYENRKETAIFQETRKINSRGQEIYGLPKEGSFADKLAELSREEYELTDKEGLTKKISRLELIDIYNSLKNDMTRERYYNTFGEDQVTDLMGHLTQEETTLADFLQEIVQGYGEIFNQRSIEITGRDRGTVENYWPATSEHEVDVYDDIRLQGETPSAIRDRVQSTKVIPIPWNALLKTMKHITQGEHVKHLSRRYERLRRLFTDRKVKHFISEKYGKDLYETILAQIDNISLHKLTTRIDAISRGFGFVFNNWVKAKVALSPSIFVKQLISIINYAEDMSSAEWADYFRKGLMHPERTFKYMWDNAPFLEARFHRGFSEAMASVLGKSDLKKLASKEYTAFLSWMVRSGDIGAIVYGGYPFVQAKIKGGLSEKEAFVEFEKVTIKSQQSRLSSGRSQFQNSRNPITRFFLAFKNVTNQYFRKQVDALISYQQGDITARQFAKITIIYSVIQPILYSFAGVALKQSWQVLGGVLFGGPGGEDEFWERAFHRIITQLAINPFIAMPLLDDLSEYLFRRLTGQKAWRVFSKPLLDDVESGFKAMGKKDKDVIDIFEIIGSLIEPVSGLPIKSWARRVKYMLGDGQKKKWK